MFLFELNKIKVAIQIVNAIFISVLSLTFIFYFTSDIFIKLISKEILLVMKNNSLGIETILDLVIKVITLPYILAGIWASVALAIREYLQS